MPNKSSYQPRETSWKANHFIHFEKGSSWYVAVTIGILVVLGLALYFRQWLLAGVMAAAMFAIFTYAKEKPAERQFRIDASGIQVGNQKYKYEELRSFWFVTVPESKILYLQPAKRFAAPVMVNLGDHSIEMARAVLSPRLPEEARGEVFSDRLNRWFRF